MRPAWRSTRGEDLLLDQVQLTRHPAGGVIGRDEWADGFLLAGYAQFLWPEIVNRVAAG